VDRLRRLFLDVLGFFLVILVLWGVVLFGDISGLLLQIVPEQPVPRNRSFKKSNALPVAGRRQVHKGAVRQNVAGRPCRAASTIHAGIHHFLLVLVRILLFLRSRHNLGVQQDTYNQPTTDDSHTPLSSRLEEEVTSSAGGAATTTTTTTRLYNTVCMLIKATTTKSAIQNARSFRAFDCRDRSSGSLSTPQENFLFRLVEFHRAKIKTASEEWTAAALIIFLISNEPAINFQFSHTPSTKQSHHDNC